MSPTNPLICDRTVDFLLAEIGRPEALCALPAFAEHRPETFVAVLAAARRLAREQLFPLYRPMDAHGARFDGRAVTVHPEMGRLYRAMVEGGFLTASRPAAVGGLELPLTVATLATAYLMAANCSAYAYLGLTLGAAHLIEAFGSAALRERFMRPMYDGAWTGTMALTEPHAGSSLADVSTRARRTEADHFLLDGTKVFISGGDQDFTANIVHLVLARIEGAPAGIRGVSLFAVPKLRPEAEQLVDNDARASGLFHKLGWKGIPSIALTLGAGGDCRGWLVGSENMGVSQMFQMMNEARILVGLNGVATASVAFHEALAYARERRQGRALEARDPTSPQLPLIEHSDVRRMLLAQKAIVEGGLALLITAARYADLAAGSPDAAVRARSQLLLDLLTPIAKSFPAERGYEANVLAVQVHGGYGYTSEYFPEAWLRDQKLNSIHEGTTGIQALDLLGRKALGGGGAALMALHGEIGEAIARARATGGNEPLCAELERALAAVGEVTLLLGARAAAGDRRGAMASSADYLELCATLVVGWQWLVMAEAATRRAAAATSDDSDGGRDFLQGKLHAARYWFATEMPRITTLAARIAAGPPGYADMGAEHF